MLKQIAGAWVIAFMVGCSGGQSPGPDEKVGKTSEALVGASCTSDADCDVNNGEYCDIGGTNTCVKDSPTGGGGIDRSGDICGFYGYAGSWYCFPNPKY